MILVAGAVLVGVLVAVELPRAGRWLVGRSFDEEPGYSLTMCASHLREIGEAIMLYANENGGRFPDRIEDLVGEELSTDVFTCPFTNSTPAAQGPSAQATAANIVAGGHLDYVYVGKGMTRATAPAGAVVAYDVPGNHPVASLNVLFADGRVKMVPAGVVKAMEGELKAGKNPPPSVKGY